MHGWWHWRNRPWFWVGGGGWWAVPNETFVYSNPYYVNTTTFLPAPIDYSLPLPIPDTQAVAAEGFDDQIANQATVILNEGRAAFKDRDYERALARADEAIRILPSDTTLHEFRALVLFAMQRYSEAAATIYAVLAVGPGWTWDTVSDLYFDPNDYTYQLRLLEAYVGANPTEPASRFLLAYHYLVISNERAATDQLFEVTRLSPEDRISAELYKSLTTTDT